MTNKAEPNVDAIETFSLVYAGRRYIGGKIYYKWVDSIHVHKGRLNELSGGNWKTQLVPVGVGVCVVFHGYGDGKGGIKSVKTATGGEYKPVVNGPISGFEEQIREWHSADAAASGEQRREQLEKRLAKSKPGLLEHHLEALRNEYRKLPPNQRAAFLAHIIYEVTD